MSGPSFRLTATAVAHYRDVLIYTARRYGLKQADIYADALDKGFQDIADIHKSFASPHRAALAKETNFALHLVGHHYIAFKISETDDVIIVGILHERMNIPVKLKELQQMSASEIIDLENDIAREAVARLGVF